MDFQERFETLLKAKSISQKELAERIGIRRPLISEWKRNKSFPYADVAVKISKILGVSVEYMITGTDATGLSQDERELVEKFKNISKENKKIVRTLIDSMLPASEVGKKSASA